MQRQSYIMLSNQYVESGDTASAIKALEIQNEFFPKPNFINDRFALMLVYAYSHVGDQVKAYDVLCDVFDYYIQQLNYVKSFPPEKSQGVNRMLGDAYYFLYQVVTLRKHNVFMRNPFNNEPEMALTDAGEAAFKAAAPDNTERLQAIDLFASSPVFQNEVMAFVNSVR